MANKKGLGVSRKFADGSVHENGTGKFVILNRYEGEDNLPWLEFQWLSGDKQGTCESNKELNMNASIHKFQTSRKAAGEIPVTTLAPQRLSSDIPIMEKIDAIYKSHQANLESVGTFFTRLDEMTEVIKKQEHTISMLSDQLHTMMQNEKILVRAQEAFVRQQEAMRLQQETLNKLVEKI